MRAEPLATALAREVSRVGALLESDGDEPDVETDGDPTVIRSRREAQELREYLRHEELLREERRQEERRQEELLRSELRAEQAREQPVRESLTRSVGQQSVPRVLADEAAHAVALFHAEDDAALSESRRARGGRSWLVLSALGVAVALGGLALLFGGQPAGRSSVALPAAKAPPIVAQRELGGVIPTMQLEVVREVEEPTAPAVSTAPPAPVLDQPAVAPALEAPTQASAAAPNGLVASDEPASVVTRAEALLRSERGPAAARDAKDLLDQVIAEERDNPHAQAALAEACLRLRDAACARAAATRAVRLRPKREAYLLLAARVQEAFPAP